MPSRPPSRNGARLPKGRVSVSIDNIPFSPGGPFDRFSLDRAREILASARKSRVLVLGDLMLDEFIWGNVRRISPEAPVPVVEFDSQSSMPGGAANVARNLSSLGGCVELFGLIGRDDPGRRLKFLLEEQGVDCRGVLCDPRRPTSVKTRIIAHQQQLVRLDREDARLIDSFTARRLLAALTLRLPVLDGIIVGDYGKGAISQVLLDSVKELCAKHRLWLSLDPKPVNKLDLRGLSLITPNRKEAFELAGLPDPARRAAPMHDSALLQVAESLLARLEPSVLLITLGDHGMLLCQPGKNPFHIPTVAREVFDVSGAGDTVIASYTLAIASGATALEAAILSNYAAGVVVGKLGTATVNQDELLACFANREEANRIPMPASNMAMTTDH